MYSNFKGFGENLDGDGSWKACVKYVDDQFMAYFDGESGLNRKNIIDTRHSIYIRIVSRKYLLYALLNLFNRRSWIRVRPLK